MLTDESLFDDIHEIAENHAYLKAIDERNVSTKMLQELPRYDALGDLESKLEKQGMLTFDHIFHEPTGYYLIKCFLVADYACDKALSVKDVESYRKMRFESARVKISKLMYERYVSPIEYDESKFLKYSTVFETLARKEEERVRSQSAGPQGYGQRSSKVASKTRSLATSTTNTKSTDVSRNFSNTSSCSLQIGDSNNPIGVYGECVRDIKRKVAQEVAPHDLFDQVASVCMTDLRLDVFPRFRHSEFFRRYIQGKAIETNTVDPANGIKGGVTVADFQCFRVLGRGGFGSVHACRKVNSGTLYAMKCINKKLVKVKSALDNVLEGRHVLTMMNSRFVTNLKYALQDEESLYFIMDLMLGGDLKFHLITNGRFMEKRARFYAAEVLLGLEHVHSKNVIYRDMKLENVLLDDHGHCRLSDLGLAVVSTGNVKGYAGTPGYTAPEMIRNKPYGPSADIFSYGVMLYRMLCGSKPFKGKVDRDLDAAVAEQTPVFPKEIFSPEATSLLQGLLQKSPKDRLGCGEKGIAEIKEHPFFSCIDWGLLEAGYVEPPFIPVRSEINAASLKDIGQFDKRKYSHIKLDEKFKRKIKGFEFLCVRGIQEEMVEVMQKADEEKVFEKFAKPNPPVDELGVGGLVNKAGCCVLC